LLRGRARGFERLPALLRVVCASGVARAHLLAQRKALLLQRRNPRRERLRPLVALGPGPCDLRLPGGGGVAHDAQSALQALEVRGLLFLLLLLRLLLFLQVRAAQLLQVVLHAVQALVQALDRSLQRGTRGLLAGPGCRKGAEEDEECC